MSNTKDNGGYAFPHTPQNVLTDAPIDGGMTLRDYFAARAMAAFCGSEVMLRGTIAAIDKGMAVNFEDHVSKASYDMADAMLKAREQ